MATEAISQLQRRAVLLAWVTLVWNAVEAGVGLFAGGRAGSLALVGLGLDSTVEVLSALVILWQFQGLSQQREQRALRLIGLSFWALVIYVTVQAIWNLAHRGAVRTSAVGIGLATASLIVMPLLASAKRRTARRLRSATVMADSNQAKLCSYLSAVLLSGLLLDAIFGWWWADSVAAIGIAALAAKEGREAWSGDVCCD